MANKTTYLAKDGLNKQLSERIYTEFVSSLKDDKGANKKLTKEFNAHMNKLTELVGLSAQEELSALLKDHYKAALDEVKKAITSGVSGVIAGKGKDRTLHDTEKGWRPLNKKYFRRKVRERPRRAGKFWKFSGDTANDYAPFSVKYRKKVQYQKGSTKLHKAGRSGRGNKVFKVGVTFTLPKPHTGGLFFERLFHDAFFTQTSPKISRGFARSNIGGSDLEIIIALLEGSAGTDMYRPLIAPIMAKHGKNYHAEYQSLLKVIHQQSIEDVLGKGAGLVFK